MTFFRTAYQAISHAFTHGVGALNSRDFKLLVIMAIPAIIGLIMLVDELVKARRRRRELKAMGVLTFRRPPYRKAS